MRSRKSKNADPFASDCTSVFIFLALVITPIVQLYIPIIPAEEEQQAVGQLDVTSLEATSAPGVPGKPPRMVYRCYCREAIQNTYTSQYIAGFAFAITAFVKNSSMSYYHLRVIYCLITMNSVIELASNFDRVSKLCFRSNRRDRPNWKMIDLVYVINIAIVWAFTGYVGIKQDAQFVRCYEYNGTIIFVTWCWFSDLCLPTFIKRRRSHLHSAGVWLTFFFLVAGLVGFLSSQIWVTTSTFQKRAVALGEADESTFTFGQIMVLFMVVPLIEDFTAAMISMSSKRMTPYDKSSHSANQSSSRSHQDRGKTIF